MNEETVTLEPEKDDDLPDDVLEESANSHSTKKKSARQRLEEAEAEVERARLENLSLKEENGRLLSEIARLEGALADANQDIYSLERKLDAIFKVNSVSE